MGGRTNLSKMLEESFTEHIVLVVTVFMPMKSYFTAEFYTAVQERLLPWLAT